MTQKILNSAAEVKAAGRRMLGLTVKLNLVDQGLSPQWLISWKDASASCQYSVVAKEQDPGQHQFAVKVSTEPHLMCTSL